MISDYPDRLIDDATIFAKDETFKAIESNQNFVCK